jgi:WD40 repeat protein
MVRRIEPDSACAMRHDVGVRWRWRWGWLWRAPLGWRLFGLVLFVGCAALPVWALTAGDLDRAARLAPLLGLPLTALGLAFVLADRDRGRVAAEMADAGRRPWMAPPLDRMVERPELGDRLVAALTAPLPGEIGLTTGLEGAGGFGKTRLATWVCHRPEIEQRYPGGLLWATVGQEVHRADLAERINDLVFALYGERPAIADPDTAGAELGRLLDEREPVLLVVDDVWEDAQLRPFRFGGRHCTRLVTTRVPDLLPPGGVRIAVDAMSSEQAARLVADGVPRLRAELAERLAVLAGRWPVLLNLVNGVLRRRVARGQTTERAADEIIETLVTEGPAAFDPARPADRSRAVAATVEASLSLLEPVDRARYLDLAIFPEDVDIPLDVLGLLWPACHVDRLCEELVGLGLVADYRLDVPGPRLVVHDVMRAYLQTRRDPSEWAAVHGRLIDGAAAVATRDESISGSWWLLPIDAAYLWRYVGHHLYQAGRVDELARLVCDLRWVEAKTIRLGSVVAVEADLELVDAPLAATLRQALRQIAPLLGPIDPPAALGATLASRLHSVPELQGALERYRATLPRPRLEPAWPLPPDQPDGTKPPQSHHSGGVTSCAFSPDGVLLATTSTDATMRVWRVADGSMRAVLTGHTGAVWDCAISPDGRLLATAGGDRTARLWLLATSAEVDVLKGHTDSVNACAFSPDGVLLATTSSDGTTRVWQVADGTTQAILSDHGSPVRSCAFDPCGTLLATTGEDGTIRLWQMPSGIEINVLPGHVGGAWACAFSPNGAMLATAGADRTVRLWNVATGIECALPIQHATRANNCQFSPDGCLLAIASYATVCLRVITNHTVQKVLTGHTASVFGCAFSPDGSQLATVGNDGARLWQIVDGNVHKVLTSHDSKVNSCCFSPEGTVLVTTSNDGTAQLWQLPEGHKQHTIIGHRGRVARCAVSPDGTLLATVSNDATARLCHVHDGTVHAVLTGHTGGVRGCAFSPDGALLATGGMDRTMRLWHVDEGTEWTILTGHTDRVQSCAFSPDGAVLASTSEDWTTRLWRIADGTQQAVLAGHTDAVNGCAFSPDGSLLATASDDRTLRLWRLSDETVYAVLTGHTGHVIRCAFSPDGTLLASASNDATVRLWNLSSGQCHCALRVAAPLSGIAWHPTASMLCTVGGGGIYMLNYQP